MLDFVTHIFRKKDVPSPALGTTQQAVKSIEKLEKSLKAAHKIEPAVVAGCMWLTYNLMDIRNKFSPIDSSGYLVPIVYAIATSASSKLVPQKIHQWGLSYGIDIDSLYVSVKKLLSPELNDIPSSTLKAIIKAFADFKDMQEEEKITDLREGYSEFRKNTIQYLRQIQDVVQLLENPSLAIKKREKLLKKRAELEHIHSDLIEIFEQLEELSEKYESQGYFDAASIEDCVAFLDFLWKTDQTHLVTAMAKLGASFYEREDVVEFAKNANNNVLGWLSLDLPHYSSASDNNVKSDNDTDFDLAEAAKNANNNVLGWLSLDLPRASKMVSDDEDNSDCEAESDSEFEPATIALTRKKVP